MHFLHCKAGDSQEEAEPEKLGEFGSRYDTVRGNGVLSILEQCLDLTFPPNSET